MENKLLSNKHVLIYNCDESQVELEYIKKNFCGRVLCNINSFTNREIDVWIYVYGNISSLKIKTPGPIFQIDSLIQEYPTIAPAELPININDIGILFRRFFDINYFSQLKVRERTLASNIRKNGKGVYFNLLRCPANFDMRTRNFNQCDRDIITRVNHIANLFFEQNVHFNHASIYDTKNLVARDFSFSTQDMDRNSLIAICIFYEHEKELIPIKLRFTPKKCFLSAGDLLPIDITLYPNSLFIFSLETNRLYTHKIIPGTGPAPASLEYVIRCSNAKAVFKNHVTHIINENGTPAELQIPPTGEIKSLEEQYLHEATEHSVIKYDKVYFSLNAGDYEIPHI
jgi:hypothetical protein